MRIHIIARRLDAELNADLQVRRPVIGNAILEAKIASPGEILKETILQFYVIFNKHLRAKLYRETGGRKLTGLASSVRVLRNRIMLRRSNRPHSQIYSQSPPCISFYPSHLVYAKPAKFFRSAREDDGCFRMTPIKWDVTAAHQLK